MEKRKQIESIPDIDDTGHYHQTRKWDRYYHSAEAYRYSHQDDVSDVSFSEREIVSQLCGDRFMTTGFCHGRLPSLDDYDRR